MRLRIRPGGERVQAFPFLPGQYLRLFIPGFPPRDYSIASQPDAADLEFHIKNQGDGSASGHIAQKLEPGDSLEIEGPFGSCTLSSDHQGPLLGVAGGTGLAPVYNILLQALRGGLQKPVTLLYGAASEAEIFLKEDFQKLSEDYENFDFSLIVSDPAAELPQGLVTDLLSASLCLDGARAYVAGPPAMVKASVQRLKALGLPDSQIRADAFGAPPAAVS